MEKDVLRSYFIQYSWMFTIICCGAVTLHMWCRCLAHMVRRVNTTCAEGKIHHDIRMTGDELWAKCCNTKNTQEVCRSLFSSNSFILCRLIRLHLFSHKAIKHRNAGKEKLFTHTIRYRTEIPFLLVKFSDVHFCIDRLFVFESSSCSKAKRK